MSRTYYKTPVGLAEIEACGGAGGPRRAPASSERPRKAARLGACAAPLQPEAMASESALASSCQASETACPGQCGGPAVSEATPSVGEQPNPAAAAVVSWCATLGTHSLDQLSGSRSAGYHCRDCQRCDGVKARLLSSVCVKFCIQDAGTRTQFGRMVSHLRRGHSDGKAIERLLKHSSLIPAGVLDGQGPLEAVVA